MIPIADFWFPILLATLLCFFAGALLHMAVPLHKRDWGGLPDEDAVMHALRVSGAAPGNYMFPHGGGPEAMKDPVYMAKFEAGPRGTMTIQTPGKFSMGPYLGKQFVFHLVVSIVIAYVVSRSLGTDVSYLRAFQVSGTVAMLAYIAGLVPEAIWYQQPRHYVVAKVVDGVVWGLLTAGSFAGFWPR